MDSYKCNVVGEKYIQSERILLSYPRSSFAPVSTSRAGSTLVEGPKGLSSESI